MQRLRIPTKVHFPFGYTVSVSLVSDKEMDEVDPNCDACWNDMARTIRIRQHLPLKRRVYLLGHELTHALADFQHCYADNGTAKP